MIGVKIIRYIYVYAGKVTGSTPGTGTAEPGRSGPGPTEEQGVGSGSGPSVDYHTES